MSEKIESDLASYIRSIAQKRGRNVALADDAVRKSASFTDKEALDDKLIDAVAASPAEIFAQVRWQAGAAIQWRQPPRLHLAEPRLKPTP